MAVGGDRRIRCRETCEVGEALLVYVLGRQGAYERVEFLWICDERRLVCSQNGLSPSPSMSIEIDRRRRRRSQLLCRGHVPSLLLLLLRCCIGAGSGVPVRRRTWLCGRGLGLFSVAVTVRVCV
jgi:hypothetical protein